MYNTEGTCTRKQKRKTKSPEFHAAIPHPKSQQGPAHVDWILPSTFRESPCAVASPRNRRDWRLRVRRQTYSTIPGDCGPPCPAKAGPGMSPDPSMTDELAQQPKPPNDTRTTPGRTYQRQHVGRRGARKHEFESLWATLCFHTAAAWNSQALHTDPCVHESSGVRWKRPGWKRGTVHDPPRRRGCQHAFCMNKSLTRARTAQRLS